MTALQEQDETVYDLIEKEAKRQKTTLNLIASENISSRAVREATSSVLSHKYSEGYPGKRYYQGNEFIDQVEQLAIDRAKQLFGAEHANVQPISGSPANFSIFLALLEPGDAFLGMDLACGGHLTHGSPVNFSGKLYKPHHYGVDKNGFIDMEEVKQLAHQVKPKLIISGHSAYAREIDFEAFSTIAQEVGALHLADISHISGLVAAGLHKSPFPHTDVVMTTTHKTLRGPRGAIILCKQEHAQAIDKAIFPGSQGGPHNNLIAAKAVAFQEAMSPAFKKYAHQVLQNAKVLAQTLMDHGIPVVTGGTDNHLLLVDLQGLLGPGKGAQTAKLLETAGIICNANSVPYDPAPPYKPSGLRLGTPMLTSQGFTEQDIQTVGVLIASVIKDPKVAPQVRKSVLDLCARIIQ